MEPIISVRGLGKSYRIQSGERKPYRTMRDDLVDFGKGLLKGQWRASSTEEFWALKDIDLDIYPGDRIGIIGRNGAGKSTLLKTLSRIVEPTIGEIILNGRLASLLEVGTGFHPELTGRENIYLNGAILGMSRLEITRKFDEIVNFSEVEKFLDTPVKRYSSGMYVRLAFSVAAHLDPEILVVDEVLAVGDVKFQKKCIGKMSSIGESGRTIIYVSHSMETVTRLCSKALLLSNGACKTYGKVGKVIDAYMQTNFCKVGVRKWDLIDAAPGNQIVRLRQVRVLDEKEQEVTNINICDSLAIEITFEVLDPNHILIAGFNFYNSSGTNLFDSHEQTKKWRYSKRPEGIHKCKVWIPGNFLAEGLVQVGAAVFTLEPFTIHFQEQEVLTFNIYDDLNENSARGSQYTGDFPGLLRPKLRWDSVHFK
jgi:lipopolysaccharide transport system ATP-binding protein